MLDQAAELRKLVLRAMRETAAQAGPTPRLLAVAGGRERVGVTTVAVNLSVAMAMQGVRVILIDADGRRAGTAGLCGIAADDLPRQIAGRRCDIHELLVRGPAGLQLVPGLWAAQPPADGRDVAQQRLIHQFRLLGRHADIVLLDVGGVADDVAGRFWLAADEVILVTTTEPAAIMDTYAAVKRYAGTLAPLPTLQLLVNSAPDNEQAADVYRRVESSCRRFLGIPMAYLGWVPWDAQVLEAAAQGKPLPLIVPEAAATVALEAMAAGLAAPRTPGSGQGQRAA